MTDVRCSGTSVDGTRCRATRPATLGPGPFWCYRHFDQRPTFGRSPA